MKDAILTWCNHSHVRLGKVHVKWNIFWTMAWVGWSYKCRQWHTYITAGMKNTTQSWCKHCAVAAVRPSQKISPRRLPIQKISPRRISPRRPYWCTRATLAICPSCHHQCISNTVIMGTQDGENLISWGWSLPLPANPVWWGSMHAFSSYHGNRPTHPPTNKQTGSITI